MSTIVTTTLRFVILVLNSYCCLHSLYMHHIKLPFGAPLASSPSDDGSKDAGYFRKRQGSPILVATPLLTFTWVCVILYKSQLNYCNSFSHQSQAPFFNNNFHSPISAFTLAIAFITMCFRFSIFKWYMFILLCLYLVS